MSIARILGIPPLCQPNQSFIQRLNRTSALGVQVVHTADDLVDLRGEYGVFLREDVPLPEKIKVVVLEFSSDISTRIAALTGREVLVVVTDAPSAELAEAAGASGLIAKGHEAGGKVGDEAAPILLQRILSISSLPVWLQGGIGVHTAGAAIALGAAGVVLDVQLALYDDHLSADVLEAIGNMDGSETAILDGHRVYDRPGALQGQGLPIGQDGAFAKAFRARYPRVGDAIRGIEWEIDSHRGQAAALKPLAVGSPFAQDHGLRYPIAQGPMTRVSDVPQFAVDVATAGALPFLALSLVRGAALETLLTDTAARLEGQPWGVGMLGFAPPELREEQLRAVRRVKPPVALLAGGRPAQARELEADGIPTYLHVPSPGLLDLFLKDGARRFVFEGRECGGHVGPRTSFVLWEQFVERLLKFDALPEVSVIFAGGIHDAATGAMASVLAAPLALAGVKVGVIMGTAYLFTEEAVSSGAILPQFQAEAIACADTVLVHTAPGHATRCAQTPFVDAFAATRARLESEGASQDQIWEALEKLNLGRLRIAAKGVRREGDALVRVDVSAQRSEGMYMIGQVAALRDGTVTMEALHREVSVDSAERLITPALQTEPGLSTDVAIIGMAGFFPGAEDLDAFWSHIVLGHDAITEVPRERWDPEQYFDPEGRGGVKSISKWGGFLPPIPFDPLEYGIPPRSLAAIEPVQLLALEAAQRALTDAGYGDGGFNRHRASVIFGAEAGTDLAGAYGFRALYPHFLGEIPEELDKLLPSLTEDSFPGVLANVIAGRIANRLDLGGVNYTVDAACASSLAALDLACKELVSGTSDLVIAGGADLHNTIADFLLFSSVQALSRTGRSRPFDADADGIALGESVNVVICKRLADAERDGDRIYAVIRGIAGSSDGKSLGLTAPRKEGQMRAVRRAYARAGVHPTEVGLAEAHGTGTVVGDKTELATLTDVFSACAVAPASITLGSVKSNVGHTKCAAGLAGIIKCALALHHQVLPPSINIRRPNPGWLPSVSPFVFRGVAAPWPGQNRHAGVSAFGFGGTNFHCVLGSHDTSVDHGLRDWPAELFLFRDLTDIDRVLVHLDAGALLVDLASSLSTRGEGDVLLAVVADSAEDLREKLALAREGGEGRGIFRRDPVDGELVFLFPGQGSQRPGMLAELFVAFPWLQEGLVEDWSARLFPGDAYDPDNRKAQRLALTDTRVAQPALGLVDLAAAKLLTSLGLKPSRLAGHSYGELVALTVAGAIKESDLLGLSEARGRLILGATGADPGTMAAVKASSDVISDGIADFPEVTLANLNSPTQTVISGSTAGIAAAVTHLESLGLEVKPIPVACAFHSPMVASAADGLLSTLHELEIGRPDRPVYANSTGVPYTDAVRQTLAEQVRMPVRFEACVRQLAADGGAFFVEVGPGRVLTRLVRQILGDEGAHRARSLEDKRGGGALSGLVRLLAQVAAAGFSLDPTVLFAGRARALDLDAAPAKPSPTQWWINGQRAWPRVGEPPDYALKLVDEPAAVSGAGAREKVVLQYLDTLREQAEQQRLVMLSYLGDAPITELPALVPEAPLPDQQVVVHDKRSPSEVLLEVVAERTGYPTEMLDLDLDLEADLSIDSIKRIEILGVLGERLGIDAGEAGRDQLVEELSGVKTLRGILDWLGDDGPKFSRFVGRIKRLHAPEPGSFAKARIAIDAGGSALGEALGQALTAAGARVPSLEDATLESLDTVILIAGPGDDADESLGRRLFVLADQMRRALTAGVRRVAVVSLTGGLEATGEGWSAGLSGLVKTVRKEWPEAAVQRIDLCPKMPLQAQVEAVSAELGDAGPVEVAWCGEGMAGGRTTRVFEEAELSGEPLSLSRESVVVLTGGARGITARMGIAFAEQSGCTVVLVGRSPAPAAEDPQFAECADAVSLRGQLIKSGLKPAEIERQVKRILANRGMRDTFEAIRRTGATLDYRAVDVRDSAAVAELFAKLYSDHGRVDWVVHGAGVNEDKLLRDKTEESFLRVFDTKVRGAQNILAALRDDVAGVAFFSSVAGAFGNRGQSDYAAANDALDQLARRLDATEKARFVSVAWGPWAGGGMVDPALERQYAELGIGLIDPEEGVRAFLVELGSGSEPHAVWMAATPEDMN